MSPLGRHYLAGLIAHARAAAAFTTPTINGYKRYHGVNSMAPIQAIWAKDNRGVMIRVLGEPGDPSTHLENRVGEPLANPYLYMASQIHAGLDGIARKRKPGPSADAPYETSAEPLPKSLAEALAALNDSACFRAGFGDAFVDYHLAHQDAPRSSAAMPKPADNPATPRRSRRGSTRNISISPDGGSRDGPMSQGRFSGPFRACRREAVLCLENRLGSGPKPVPF